MAHHKNVFTDVDVRSHENNLAHRTREIDRERLIVRRGQPFSITLQCSGPLPPKHYLELKLRLGKRDEVVIMVQKERGAGDKWWFNQQEAQGEIVLTLHSPANAIIGHYQLGVLLLADGRHIVERIDKVAFHMLFNPWCKDDVVYLPDESLLQEYIMNEDGVIYQGAWDYIQSNPWNFGQFEDFVMDICFEVLDNSNNALRNSVRDMEHRFDPVYVSRIITAMVNSNDDRGVLRGQWHEPYTGGVPPYQWTGSVKILRQWSKTGFSPVKYGQCWVFAAVACTVMRCLGIPSRVITNFESAHDVDGNLSVDIILNDRLETVDKKDSKWNFHCWIESWMKRDDLSKGCDGWQVLDPTPQEQSEGEYRCGPCPVTAIKEGNLDVKYDAPFVFAEVNADIIVWVVKPDGQRNKVREDQKSVGKNISTKSPYGNYREDVTSHYKYPEGSREERKVYEKAGHRVTGGVEGNTKPGQLQLSIKHAKPVFGTDFDVIVEVKNTGSKEAHAQLTMVAMAVTYNSIHRGECQREATNITVPAHKVHKHVLRMHYDHYVKCVSGHHLIRVKALLDVLGENEPIMDVANIPLSTPELLVEVPGKAVLWEQLTAHVSFTNPLPVPLKGGIFTVEGAGLLPATEIPVKGDVAPGQKVFVKFSFSPMRAGVKTLMVGFDSDRLKDVKGVGTVVIRKKYIRPFPENLIMY